jgi:hypothetical protein
MLTAVRGRKAIMRDEGNDRSLNCLVFEIRATHKVFALSGT